MRAVDSNRATRAIVASCCAVLAACSAPPAPIAPAIETISLDPPVVPRLLPPEYVIAGDDRPLTWRQQDLLLETFDLESKSLVLEAELAKALPEGGGKSRLERIPGDRLSLTAQISAARIDAHEAMPVVKSLQPIDRVILEFARERLVTDGYALKEIDTWWRANRRFLESRDLADRDAALGARIPAFTSLAKAMPLRKLIADIEHGKLADAGRAEALGTLKLTYPDAPLPVAAIDSVTPAKTGSAAVVKGPQDGMLPNLDGGSHPIRAIENLGALLEKKP